MSWAAIQAAYAAHRVATYPMAPTGKTPGITNWQRVGAVGSAHLAIKFGDALAAGFNAGGRNRITVVDIDDPDDKLLAEILRGFGETPLQVMTPSGGRHLYYRFNGEKRRIKPLPKVDILGAGNVVCAGSVTPKGRYTIERGMLDALDRLPPMRSSPVRERVPAGQRNGKLYDYCHSIARHCGDQEQLLDAARSWATRMEQPANDILDDAEIVKTANSAWRRRDGGKLFMQHIIEGALFPRLVADPEVWTVCSYLMIEQGPEAEFWIADGLGEARGWPRRMVPKARKAMLAMGLVECIRPAGNGVPALYRWRPPEESRPTDSGR